MSQQTKPQPVTLVVARREARNILKSKAMKITAILLLIFSIGAPIIAKYAMDKGPSTYQVGVLAEESPEWTRMADAVSQQIGTKIEFRKYSDLDAAKKAVTDGEVDMALEPLNPARPYAYRAYQPNQPVLQLQYIVQGILQQAATGEVLAQSGVSPADLAAAAQEAELQVTSVKGDQTDVTISYVVSIVGIILIMMFVWVFGQIIGQGVVEEKASRIIEVIMATVRPLQLLWGKIIGIGAVAFLYMLIAVVAGGLSLHFTGIIPDAIQDQITTQLPLLLVCMVLAFLFFASLYAATGAMVSRTEDFSAAITPIIMITMFLYVLPAMGMLMADSTLFMVLSWIPPFSLTMLPMQVAFGNATMVQIIVALLLNVIATVVVVWLASRIYENTVLNIGSRVRWRDALKQGGRATKKEKTSSST
ncbi:MAG TPA: ABC transporter permease [Corynebacteriales bacterium]|nr:ABC transporter permease [Mycobacteriales bacterium]